jgi:hypothetical protein
MPLASRTCGKKIKAQLKFAPASFYGVISLRNSGKRIFFCGISSTAPGRQISKWPKCEISKSQKTNDK